MSYVEKHLIPGETVQFQTKLHWIVMLGHVAIAAVFELLAITFLITSFSSSVGAKGMPSRGAVYFGAFLCLLVGAVLFCIGLLKRNATEMAVTNKRVIAKTGVANRRSIEILLSRIESVVVDEPAMGRILGYGTVIVRGTGGTPEIFEKIYHPLDFREQVQRQIASDPKSS
ncbi:MAG TPA: PH domain-containing protein [Candidatus Acidoferrum sp.]|nr:PH domain-containing protein [Candidatus Acidoferrum sp.]